MKFGQRPCTRVQGLLPDFGATLQVHKNPILIGIISNLLHNIRTCICVRKCNKNEEFSPGEIWPWTLYRDFGPIFEQF